jgi:glucose/mannose-6-phosphate isomerase
VQGVEGLKRGAKIVGIAAGGKLEEFLKVNGLPGYIFQPRFNPCGQPRMGLGYSIIGILAILAETGLLEVSDSEIESAIAAVRKANEKYNFKVKKSTNLAKKIAEEARDRIPVLVGAEFLAGNVHTIANQINENAKTISFWFLLPELNHHLLEGLVNPKSNAKDLVFLFLNSNLYSPKIQKRVEITKEVVRKNKIEILEFKPESGSEIEQSFEILTFGSWFSFYLAILNNLDPTPIFWVDYFKKKLAG